MKTIIDIINSTPFLSAEAAMLNRHRNKAQWDAWAVSQGYTNLKDFLYCMYVEKSMTTREIGGVMGLRKDRVSQLMVGYNIPLRRPGGLR